MIKDCNDKIKPRKGELNQTDEQIGRKGAAPTNEKRGNRRRATIEEKQEVKVRALSYHRDFCQLKDNNKDEVGRPFLALHHTLFCLSTPHTHKHLPTSSVLVFS